MQREFIAEAATAVAVSFVLLRGADETAHPGEQVRVEGAGLLATLARSAADKLGRELWEVRDADDLADLLSEMVEDGRIADFTAVAQRAPEASGPVPYATLADLGRSLEKALGYRPRALDRTLHTALVLFQSIDRVTPRLEEFTQATSGGGNGGGGGNGEPRVAPRPRIPPRLALAQIDSLKAHACLAAIVHASLYPTESHSPELVELILDAWNDGMVGHLALLSIMDDSIPADVLPPARRLNLKGLLQDAIVEDQFVRVFVEKGEP
jgi:hypothetical protein